MAKDPAREVIKQKKRELGRRLVILVHHYQNDEIIPFADFVGDSLELARKVPQIPAAEIIVFCGVYFMAETAVILAPDKMVFIPDKTAGCPLADMAKSDDVARAWDVLKDLGAIIPITYVNSSAAVKAFCGRNKGAVCTSGNANKVFAWAFSQAERIFFMPDKNLGENTARAMGIDEDEMAIWDPLDLKDMSSFENAKVILWKGWCPVHWPVFTEVDVEKIRKEYPGIKVIVHPESDPETVQASDASGSTSQIIKYVESLQRDAKVAVGTETNMVNRLAESCHAFVKVVPLKEVYCDDMAKITLEKLALCLSDLSRSARVRVPEEIIRDARIALDRMLRI